MKPDTTYIYTEGTEDIEIKCKSCGNKITSWRNIFEGDETSYLCPKCEYEGYAYKFNTKIKGVKV
jgi:Zn finger protein HypA/HybF involved in hydrogenase expression